jgi:hypothetical protein
VNELVEGVFGDAAAGGLDAVRAVLRRRVSDFEDDVLELALDEVDRERTRRIFYVAEDHTVGRVPAHPRDDAARHIRAAEVGIVEVWDLRAHTDPADVCERNLELVP